MLCKRERRSRLRLTGSTNASGTNTYFTPSCLTGMAVFLRLLNLTWLNPKKANMNILAADKLIISGSLTRNGQMQLVANIRLTVNFQIGAANHYEGRKAA